MAITFVDKYIRAHISNDESGKKAALRDLIAMPGDLNAQLRWLRHEAYNAAQSAKNCARLADIAERSSRSNEAHDLEVNAEYWRQCAEAMNELYDELLFMIEGL
jgi:hypothetical protein